MKFVYPVTATLRDAEIINEGGKRLRGKIYGDDKGRFVDGEVIVTSRITTESGGNWFGTLNSAYGVETWAGANDNFPVTIRQLQAAHVERQEEWCPDQKPDLSFRGNEMGGEAGEAMNVIKKLERERHGWAGSRDTVEHLGEELADVVHTAILCAITAGIDLEPYVVSKFNATSEKVGLLTRLVAA